MLVGRWTNLSRVERPDVTHRGKRQCLLEQLESPLRSYWDTREGTTVRCNFSVRRSVDKPESRREARRYPLPKTRQRRWQTALAPKIVSGGIIMQQQGKARMAAEHVEYTAGNMAPRRIGERLFRREYRW